MGMLAHNLSVIARRQQDIAEKAMGAQFTDRVVLFQAMNGSLTMEVAGQLMHSPFDPEREAKRILINIEDHPTENIVFFGCGLGYHIMEYLQRERYRDLVIIVEPDPEVFRCWLDFFDLTPYIEKQQFVFCVGETPREVADRFRTDEMTLIRNGLRSIRHPPTAWLHEEYAKELDNEFYSLMSYCKLNNNTRNHSWYKYGRNAACNVPEAARLPGVEKLQGKFKGVPAFCVAAGPSLGKNMHELKRAKGRGLIIACGTALRSLLAADIEPDFTAAIDYGPDTYYRHLADVDTSRTRLVVDYAVHPKVLSEFKGQRFFMGIAGRPLSSWIREVIGEHGGVQKGLTVAHTAVLLALYFGCSPIVLVGQDLAFTGDQSHVAGAALCRSSDKYAEEERALLVEVPGMNGQMVKTTPTMEVYRVHFEALFKANAKHVPDGFINATEGGRSMAHTKEMMLSAVIDAACDGAVPIDETIEKAARYIPRAKPARRRTVFKRVREDLRALNADARKMRGVFVEIMQALVKPQRDLSRLRALRAKHDRAVKRMDSHQLGFMFLSDAMSEPHTLMRDRRLHPARMMRTGTAEHVEAIKLHISILNRVQIAARFWLQLLGRIESRVRQRRRKSDA